MGETVRFVDKNEVAIADLKNGFLNNILSGEGLMKENAIITDKRIYYNKKQGLLLRIEEWDRVDIDDITAVKIARAASAWFIVLGLIVAAVLVILKVQNYMIFAPSAVIIGVLIDLILSKNYLSIEYAGGYIRFSVKKYKMEHVARFQETVFRVKDSLKSRPTPALAKNDFQCGDRGKNAGPEQVITQQPVKTPPKKPSSIADDTGFFED